MGVLAFRGGWPGGAGQVPAPIGGGGMVGGLGMAFARAQGPLRWVCDTLRRWVGGCGGRSSQLNRTQQKSERSSVGRSVYQGGYVSGRVLRSRREG